MITQKLYISSKDERSIDQLLEIHVTEERIVGTNNRHLKDEMMKIIFDAGLEALKDKFNVK